MSTRVLSLVAMQEPFSYGLDENSRTQFSCNYEGMCADTTATLETDLVTYLVSQGLGTFGTSIFIGPAARIPTGDGPFISVISTGGMPSLDTHNSDRYCRFSIQIIVTALSYVAARTHAHLVYDELNGVYSSTIG